MCVVIASQAIRARWPSERLPVHEDEWDAADYLRQRAQAYREAIAAIAQSDSTAAGAPRIALRCVADAAAPPGAACLARCAHSGDAVHLEPGAAGAALQALIVQAAQRVFADTGAWRRSLRPAYFARHRAWRARVGAPVQH